MDNYGELQFFRIISRHYVDMVNNNLSMGCMN